MTRDQMANLAPIEQTDMKPTWSHCKRHTHLYHTALEIGQENDFGNAKTKIYLTKPDGSGELFVLADQLVLCFQWVWEERFKKDGGRQTKKEKLMSKTCHTQNRKLFLHLAPNILVEQNPVKRHRNYLYLSHS